MYKNYLKLLEKWPLDKTKEGRDFGELIRRRVQEGFRAGSVVGDANQCRRNYESLNRLANDYYKKRYPRSAIHSSSRLGPEYCKILVSNENLENTELGKTAHVPVLAHRVVEMMKAEKAEVILDATFGAGGHAAQLLRASPSLKIICLDRDPLAYEYACMLEAGNPGRVIPLLGKFSQLPALLKGKGFGQNSLDGILFDFGASSMQMDSPDRGFSISKEGPLDMRMNKDEESSFTAADVVAHLQENDLHKIFKIYGEERLSRKIARGIVEARYNFKPVRTTYELAELVDCACDGEKMRTDKLGRRSHVATKVFQALRIFVNDELNEINHAMILAQRYLKIGGVMATICFHSLEDTIVKRHATGHVTNNVANQLPLKYYSFNASFDEKSLLSFKKSHWHQIHKHVIQPSDYEIHVNPRSRSARLRVCIKL